MTWCSLGVEVKWKQNNPILKTEYKQYLHTKSNITDSLEKIDFNIEMGSKLPWENAHSHDFPNRFKDIIGSLRYFCSVRSWAGVCLGVILSMIMYSYLLHGQQQCRLCVRLRTMEATRIEAYYEKRHLLRWLSCCCRGPHGACCALWAAVLCFFLIMYSKHAPGFPFFANTSLPFTA